MKMAANKALMNTFNESSIFEKISAKLIRNKLILIQINFGTDKNVAS